ncbi:J domain-containing protein [Myroides sp. LJL119]
MDLNQAYTILGLEPNASLEQVKMAYSKLSKQYHPDQVKDDAFLLGIFRKINIAYSVLITHNQQKEDENLKGFTNREKDRNVNSGQTGSYWDNSAFDALISNYHQSKSKLEELNKQVVEIQRAQTKKYLSVFTIFKLIGIAFFIFVFFNPFYSKIDGVINQTSQVIPLSKWTTKHTAKLYSKPDIKSLEITLLDQNIQVDSITSTNYFFKVQVEQGQEKQIGYILKTDLVKQ